MRLNRPGTAVQTARPQNKGMATKVLSAPPAGSPIDVIVDWLELEAFLSRFGVASVDDVISTQDFQANGAETDIGEKDRADEERRTEVEAEISFRSSALGGAYPFQLSDDGEQLLMTANNDFGEPSSTYLVCLILSHVTQSPILSVPPKPEMVRLARKRLFQIIATLAAAGHAQGGAVSLGWPREKKETIIQVVARAVDLAQTGQARAAPHDLEPKGAKDGGLDVLAWKIAPDGPPPEMFYFVQAASGNNWIAKSAKGDYDQFAHCYFSAKPECGHHFMTICPFRLSEDQKKYQQLAHGIVSDRTRAPVMAMTALQSAGNGAPIDEAENFPIIGKWLARYRRENRSTH